MNKKHSLNMSFKRLFAGLTQSHREKAFILLSAAFWLISLTSTNAKAACQTPQFALPVTLNIGRPAAAAAGDFNRDGITDLAVLRNLQSGAFPGIVEVFLNNGGGIFTSTGIQYNALPVGGQILINDLATADFNNDSRLDLVAVGTGNGTAAILLGDGNGGFGQPTNFGVAGNSSTVAVGDFNQDGNIDIVTKGFSSASVLPGAGNGSFNAPLVVSTGNGGANIVVRDFNSDGLPDFAAANNSSTSQTVSVRLGSGNFIFTAPPEIPVARVENIAVNDFNRDGRSDFATVNRSNDDVSVFLGLGNGTFNSPNGSPFPVGDFPEEIASADFNSDNIPDLAVGYASISNSLSILLNNGSGVFGSPFNFSPEPGAIGKIYAVDYDRNRATDLIIVKEETQNKVVLLRNLCPPVSSTMFDFDGDAKADVSVFRPSNGTWYLLRSQQGFSGVPFGISTDSLAPADYDGDGRTDVAVFRDGSWFILRSSNATVSSVGFGASGDLPRPGDFDSDGRADISVYRPSNGVWYRLNSSTNLLVQQQFGASNDLTLLGDFDGDGRTDLTIVTPDKGLWRILQSTDNSIREELFGVPTDIFAPADYDGDGRTDIAVYRPSLGKWYIKRSSSNGKLRIAQFGIPEDRPVPADYDGDGQADIAVYRPSNGGWYRLNSTTGAFVAISFGAINDRPTPAAYVP